MPKVWPKIIAEDLVNVQPMTGPVGGVVFYKPRYESPKTPLQELAERANAEFDITDDCPKCGGEVELPPGLLIRVVKFNCKEDGCGWFLRTEAYP